MEDKDYWAELFSAFREKEWSEAIDKVDSLIKKEPFDPDHFVRLGDLCMNNGNTHDAVAAYKEALGLFRKDGSTDKAILLCKKILSIATDEEGVGGILSELLSIHEKTSGTSESGVAEQGKKAAAAQHGLMMLRALLSSGKAPDFLKELLTEAPAHLLDQIGPARFKSDDKIINEGDAGDSLFVILRGSVEVSSVIRNKKILLTRLSPGDIFGEMAFLTSKPRAATVIAITNVELAEFKRPVLEYLIELKPRALKYLFTMYTARVDTTISKLKKAEAKLSGYLEELPLPDILQIFEQSKKEGVLFITANDRSGSISFKDGLVTGSSFGEVTGEDALVELIPLVQGAFAYDPCRIVSPEAGRPAGFVLMECTRLMDEKKSLRDYLPARDCRLTSKGIRTVEDPEMNAVLAALAKGVLTMDEIRSSSGMSRIRTEVTVAKLIRDGYVSVKGPAA